MAREQLELTTRTAKSGAGVSLTWKATGAFLGAAVGDALGWPQERSSHGGSAPQHTRGAETFRGWTRKTGGRYLLHDEPVRAGEYSDDTQLILATARSLLKSTDWSRYFAVRELTLWTVFERGGGGATKRAAAAWASGRPPWEQRKSSDITRYFSAGGNGVVMRIMPHVFRHAASTRFEDLAREIVVNGICTHGHPRALVGALAYGFATWRATKQSGTLGYGELIEETIRNISMWSQLPNVSSFWSNWNSVADRALGDYEALWDGTVHEMLDLLALAKQGIELGALAVDREILSQMGTFNRQINGSGTVTAAGALFLASRYAADPLLGVLEAAFAVGGDTDTLASMVGAILGALSGDEWMAGYVNHVQDSDYVRKIAQALASSATSETTGLERPVSIAPIAKRQLDAFKKRVEQSHEGDSLQLPDGTSATVAERSQSLTRTKNTDAVLVRLDREDGQISHVKLFTRRDGGQEKNTQGSGTKTSTVVDDAETPVIRTGIRLAVRDLEASRRFYETVLGLSVIGRQEDLVTFKGGISLAPSTLKSSTDVGNSGRVMSSLLAIYIETTGLSLIYGRVQRREGKVIRPITEGKALWLFQCEDPDGNLVEVFERKIRSNGEKTPPILPNAESASVTPTTPSAGEPKRRPATSEADGE